MRQALSFSLLIAYPVILIHVPLMAGVVSKVTRELIEATVDRAARQSGRELVEKDARKSASDTLERLVKTHGDDALAVVRDGGLELLESVPKYGDDVIDFAIKSSPAARRAFAIDVPGMLPLVRKIGVEVLELEAKTPGLAAKVFSTFGGDGGRHIAKYIPTEDIPRLLSYAEKADNPETRNLLLETYQKEGKSLFERVPAKLVLASGLTASMLYGTHELTGPLRKMANAIENSPDVARTAVTWFISCGAVVVLIVLVSLLWRYGQMPWQKKLVKQHR